MDKFGRLVDVTHKPRLLKHGGVWRCVGFKERKSFWPDIEYIAEGFGLTPAAAYVVWKMAPLENAVSFKRVSQLANTSPAIHSGEC